MVDNRAMRATGSPVHHRVGRAIAVGALALAAFGVAPAAAADPSTTPVLREQFPAGSIDSTPRADAALAATGSAKTALEKEYKAQALACAKEFLVNACLDRARVTRRTRLADVTAVELDAERYKRRERADRVEADRARRDVERTSHQAADDAQRAGNRATFDERQARTTRDTADRARSDARRAGSPKKKPGIEPPSAAAVEANVRLRAKNAADHAKKVEEANAHRQEIARRVAAKTADRKRRADDKAAKEAAALSRQAAPAAVRR